MENKKLRFLDYVIGFIICFVMNVTITELPLNGKNIITIILGSCVFAIVFGGVTNFVFKGRSKKN